MARAAEREFVDLHNHLVPGVDDGCATIAESLNYLHALADDGVSRLAVSPHLDAHLVHEPGALYKRLDRLEAAFHELSTARDLEVQAMETRPMEGQPVRRRSRARPSMGSRPRSRSGSTLPTLTFSQEILVPDAGTAELVFLEPRIGIRGTNYATIEFGFELPPDPVAVVHAVRDAGRRPIVVHPERYRRDYVQVTIEEIEEWKSAGAILQVNGGSLLNGYGEGIAEIAWELLGRGLADLLGTDHHGASRPVSPIAVVRKLERRGAYEEAHLLFSENPGRILDNDETLRVPPYRV